MTLKSLKYVVLIFFCQISMLMLCFDEKNRAFLCAPEIDLRAHRKLVYEPDFSRQITLITILNFIMI